MRQASNLLLVLIFVISGVLTEETNEEGEDFSKWQVLYRIIKDCGSRNDPSACFKLKFMTFLDRAYAIKQPLMLTEYLKLVRDPEYQEDEIQTGRTLSESELENILVQSPGHSNEILDEMLMQKVDAFFNSRSIQLNFPMEEFTGRTKKKKKKKLKKLLIFAIAAVVLVKLLAKLLIGKIALVAVKSLLIGKIALVLSIFGLFKKKIGGGGGGDGGGETTAQVVYATAEEEHHHENPSGAGWQRRNPQEAHDLVYSGYRDFSTRRVPIS